ncbi:MAG: hypothetical protein E6Q27_06355 [Aeromicrobium sp.]|nr:MAG: hypothetical protein E6Q27_06355 [Aeromicrobium sp.]
MSRRVNLPGAEELFRSTVPARGTGEDAPTSSGESTPASSGRVKHDEKMTVYLTSEELLAIEHARLTLKSMVGRKIDRGRIVRAALAIALADLEENGDSSEIVGRLSE